MSLLTASDNTTPEYEATRTDYMPIGNDPLTPDELAYMVAVGQEEDRKLKQDLPKKNYLNIHKKRRKR